MFPKRRVKLIPGIYSMTCPELELLEGPILTNIASATAAGYRLVLARWRDYLEAPSSTHSDERKLQWLCINDRRPWFTDSTVEA